MKTFFAFLIAVGKFYLGFRIMWWIFQKFTNPELHSFSEIEVYFVFLVFDIWLTGQNTVIEKYQGKNEI